MQLMKQHVALIKLFQDRHYVSVVYTDESQSMNPPENH